MSFASGGGGRRERAEGTREEKIKDEGSREGRREEREGRGEREKKRGPGERDGQKPSERQEGKRQEERDTHGDRGREGEVKGL